jgi:tRNA(Glu) U13 pseudouridine synthase TruD
MTGNSKEKFEKSEAVFKLQAYASQVFNEYAEKRAKNKKVLDGDIVARRADKTLQYGMYKASNRTVRSCEVKNKDNTDFFFYPKARGEEILYDAEKMVVT